MSTLVITNKFCGSQKGSMSGPVANRYYVELCNYVERAIRYVGRFRYSQDSVGRACVESEILSRTAIYRGDSEVQGNSSTIMTVNFHTLKKLGSPYVDYCELMTIKALMGK